MIACWAVQYLHIDGIAGTLEAYHIQVESPSAVTGGGRGRQSHSYMNKSCLVLCLTLLIL